jgi:hypothetical protein
VKTKGKPGNRELGPPAGGDCSLAAILLIVRMVFPEVLPAGIDAELSEHVAPERPGGKRQVKSTAAGSGVFAGIVATSSFTVVGVPLVICTVPGTSSATLKSVLVREKLAVVVTPGTLAVTV